MRLARRALVVALTTLMLCAAVSAQTLRQENDPRNIAPTVGTGGSPGGPTGLFTIYDGNTLRRGEFTFSVAYSNYDRDPGNVDIAEVPISFQIGVNDHLELFYNTDAYRGVKVNSPRNLSSFYLPNSQLYFGQGILGTGPAIILSPERVSGPTIPTNAPIFRPAFCPTCPTPTSASVTFFRGGQPFVQFPFVGAAGPNLGLTGNNIAPPFVSRLGVPTGGGGNFSGAASFPGIGSFVGSILPGIVLSTRTIPANSTFNALIIPDTFTIAPTYMADAPFINRLYGETSFSTHTFGGQIRLTDPDSAFNVSVLPMYRFYMDKPDDTAGFNQLQRGASPGGEIGDFGLFGVVGGRLSRSVNVSVNFGYFLNSNPQSDAFGGDKVSLLDRPNEFMAGIGLDFPVNKHFQPIVEVKSIHYVGSKTPNAFENNPVDFLAGVRIYPSRWYGMSFAYRGHVNQQGDRLFSDGPTFPTGFQESVDPHGFIVQLFAGHRNERAPSILPNQPPTVSLSGSASTVRLPAECGPDEIPGPCEGGNNQVTLAANATDPDGDTLLYTYSTTGGRIVGDGPNATLDLSGAQPGTYTVTVEVDDGCGCVAFSSTTVTVERCPCIAAGRAPAPCPTIRVSCPDSVPVGSPITFTASVEQGDASVTPTFNWSVSAGTITSGQGTSSITVDTTGIGGQTVTATVDVGGYDRSCSGSNSCTTSVVPEAAQPRKVDEYGNIRFNDEKARLDNFAIALQNEPGSSGTIIAYGGRRGRSTDAQQRADRARDYLVNERGIDASRIQTIDGGLREELTVELWIVPTGATPPTASPTVDASEQVAPAPRRRSRRGRRDDDE